MLNIPSALQAQFETCLRHKVVPKNTQAAYTKWLRYYLDFCHKYHFPQEQQESLPHFLKKLQDKRQTKAQQEQAAQAVTLYYELLASIPTPGPRFDKLRTGSQADSGLTEKNTPQSPSRGESIPVPPGSAILFAGGTPALPGQPTPGPSQADSGLTGNTGKMPTLPGQPTPGPSQEGNVAKGQTPPELPDTTNSGSKQVRTGSGSSWKVEYDVLAETLQGRQYAPKIARAYTKWVRKFQAFTRSKAPDVLSSEDARAFLAWLPTKRKMSFSQQTQVFEALLFFYKHVLKKELGVERPIRAQTITTSEALTANDTEGLKPSPRTVSGVSWEAEFTTLKHAIQIKYLVTLRDRTEKQQERVSFPQRSMLQDVAAWLNEQFCC